MPLYPITNVSVCPTRYQGLTPNKDIFEKHIADLSAKLDVYDQILSKQKYIAGDVRNFHSAPRHEPP